MNSNQQKVEFIHLSITKIFGRLTYSLKRNWLLVAIFTILAFLFLAILNLYFHRLDCLDIYPRETALPTKRMPLTDKAFVILGLALTVSTYISSVSRDVVKSLKSDLHSIKDAKRINQLLQKSQQLRLLLLSDLLVWALIVFPVLIVIWHWYTCLPATKPFFGILQLWIIAGVMLLSIWMAIMHGIQAWQHFKVVDKGENKCRGLRLGPTDSQCASLGPTLLHSNHFLEDLLLVKGFLSEDEASVYTCVANRTPRMKIDESHKVHWQVTVSINNLSRDTDFDLYKTRSLLSSLEKKKLLALESSEGPEVVYSFPRFDQLYDIGLDCVAVDSPLPPHPPGA